jgi:peptidyl-prolyl cis-trans isomerase B (cyclophilin B)
VGHPDPALRAAALAALARQDPEQLALVLSGSDPDPVWFVRAALVRALGAADGEFALGLVFAALRDADGRVLAEAIKAFGRLKGNDATDTLRKYLQHGDPLVRAAAAEALATLKAPGLGAAVGDAYQRSLADPDCAARAALVGALATDISDPATAALQLAAGRDGCPALRERAAAALGARGLTAPPQLFQGARAFVDDRVALAPFAPLGGLPLFTPRVFIHTPRGVIEMHLNVVEAPLACASFSWLARRGFYNGLIVDDVVPGVAVWGGSARGDSLSGPGFALRGEAGERPFGPGAVGLVRPSGMHDMEGSRFVIALSPANELDGSATLLGWVASGMDVVGRLRPGDAIERIQVWDGR